MNKVTLKDRLIDIQKTIINEINEKIVTTHSMVDVDESDTIDSEDLSHQTESMLTEQLFKVKLQKAENDLQLLDQISFDAKTKVEPGAFVKTEMFHFAVAMATVPFDLDGIHIIGISSKSPIYTEMKGLEKGDSFNFTDKSYTILEIH
jgi:hypothetical protein